MWSKYARTATLMASATHGRDQRNQRGDDIEQAGHAKVAMDRVDPRGIDLRAK